MHWSEEMINFWKSLSKAEVDKVEELRKKRGDEVAFTWLKTSMENANLREVRKVLREAELREKTQAKAEAKEEKAREKARIKEEKKKAEEAEKITKEEEKLLKRMALNGPSATHWSVVAYKEPAWNPALMHYMKYQQEIAPEQTRQLEEDPSHEVKVHWQTSVSLKIKTTKKVLYEAMGLEWNEALAQPTRYLEKYREYCGKEETAVPGTMREFGDEGKYCPGQGLRSDIEDLAARIRGGEEPTYGETMRFNNGIKALHERLARERAPTYRDIDVKIFWGPEGYGKDTMAEEIAKDLGLEVYDLPRRVRGQGIIWPGYFGQKCLRIRDFDGWMSFEMMLDLTDPAGLRYLDVKNGGTYGMWSHVFITSNLPPQEWWRPGEMRAGPGAFIRRISEIRHMNVNMTGVAIRAPIIRSQADLANDEVEMARMQRIADKVARHAQRDASGALRECEGPSSGVEEDADKDDSARPVAASESGVPRGDQQEPDLRPDYEEFCRNGYFES